MTPEKADFNVYVNPLLIVALIATILCSPSGVKCSFRLTISRRKCLFEQKIISKLLSY
jgi:hypothetical protein